MEIRQATYKDLNSLMNVFDEAKHIMRSCGNLKQWNEGYPSLDIVSKDIESGYCIVACEGNEILATMSLIPGPEITYSFIEGSWPCDDPYYVIHRMASTTPGRNIASKLFDWAFEYIRQFGLNTIRIDTHRDNCIMKHVLTKYGFKECGVIYLENGDPRDAYIKVAGLIVDVDKPKAEALYARLGFRHLDNKDFFGHPMKHMVINL